MTKYNFHAIVGANGMCECGIRENGDVVTCGNLLKEEFAQLLAKERAEGRSEAVEYVKRIGRKTENTLIDEQTGEPYDGSYYQIYTGQLEQVRAGDMGV